MLLVIFKRCLRFIHLCINYCELNMIVPLFKCEQSVDNLLKCKPRQFVISFLVDNGQYIFMKFQILWHNNCTKLS